jgi:hypothetical protein
MNKRKKILSGILALAMGLTLSLPIKAAARDWDHDGDSHHHAWHGDRARGDWDHDGDYHGRNWRWQAEGDHYRGYPYYTAPGYAHITPYNGYAYRRGYLPENGQGMVNPRNPNLFWACDSDGHHCRWARR